MFGGGGGHLQVTSALSDSEWYDGEMFDDEPNQLWLNPGNAPLTLQLSGPLSFTGGTYVDGSVLVFDTPVPTVGAIFIGERTDTPGYVGVTANSQFIFDGSGGAGFPTPRISSACSTPSSSGVIGFYDGGTVASAQYPSTCTRCPTSSWERRARSLTPAPSRPTAGRSCSRALRAAWSR